MYPNDNQQSPTSIDYLNQIAPKATQKNNLLQSKPILFGSLVIVILIIIIAITSSLSGGLNPSQQLAARLTSTQAVSTDATTKIKNNQLLGYNGALNIYLINTIRDIKPLLAKDSIDIDHLSASVTTAESNTTVLATLEDARLNAVYDRTYAREMSYRLDTTLTLMRQIYESTSNSNLKNFLEGAYKNLAPIQKQFADFNAADS